MKFLLINYTLKIKNIYKEVEPRMTSFIESTLRTGKTDRIVADVYPYAERAFQEGVEFGNFISGRNRKQELTGKDKKKLFEQYITALKIAESIFKLKTNNLTEKGTPKYDMFLTEYVSTMTRATNKLLVDAGALGMRKAVR